MIHSAHATWRSCVAALALGVSFVGSSDGQTPGIGMPPSADLTSPGEAILLPTGQFSAKGDLSLFRTASLKNYRTTQVTASLVAGEKSQSDRPNFVIPPPSVPIAGVQPPAVPKVGDGQLGEVYSQELVGDYYSDSEYAAAEADEVARELKYGEPEVSQARAFLRQQTPLLRAGQSQVDYGFQYSVFEADFPTLINTTLAEANVTSRRLESLLGFRYGVTDELQFFTSTTLGWTQTDFFDGVNNANVDAGGIGDLNFGVNYLWRQESQCSPALILSVDATAPTGNDIEPLLLTDAGMGSGVWATSTRLLAVRSFDPLVLFGGVGYRYTFEDTFRNNEIDLGDQILYNFGVGFAANERVTLSAAYSGAFVTDYILNQNIIEGSAFDIGSMRFAATILKCNKIYEPFVEIGTTDRTPSTNFGILMTR